VNRAPYDALNLGDHVGDDPGAVAANRELLAQALRLPAEPRWLQQVHGTRVVDAAGITAPVAADAAYAREPNVVCAVLTADCLPVLLCDLGGRVIAAAHAGWRGLAAGVLERTVTAMRVPGSELLAWLGPAIGVVAYLVGDEVRDTFLAHDPAAAAAFRPGAGGGWHADLYLLARQRLQSHGVNAVYGGEFCTFQEAARFYSFRRDGVTGRMASLIWLQDI
jgi:YfiH family protein